MTEKSGIAAALAKAQMAMGKARKDTTNTHFKSKYADLTSVMDACMPALNENGIAVYQPVRVEGGTTFVDTVLLHSSGETLQCSLPLVVGKNDMQGLGSAITYARRYGLMCMAGIAPEDDDGNAAVEGVQKAQANAKQPEPQRPELTIEQATIALQSASNVAELVVAWNTLSANMKLALVAVKDARKAELEPKPQE